MERVAHHEFRGTDRFDVLRQIGEGAAGLVYEVRDRESNSRLALKSLRTLSAEAILLFKSEFRAVQDLSHPNLVALNELFEVRGDWFFTMEYIQGESFISYVRERQGPRPNAGSGALGFDEGRLRSALSQLVTGLLVLHGSHKVHRDIKPSNVIVTREGRVVILDFGIVSDLALHRDADQEGIVGTVRYMAPEQAASELVLPAADWYAVGTVLYEALTGEVPFDGPMHEVLARKLTEEAPAPDARVAGLPRDLVELCVELLRIDPAQRPEGNEIAARLGVASHSHVAPASLGARFVGRARELGIMADALSAARDGSAVTLLVEGESGVGKSCLVREFTSRAVSEHGTLVFRGRCYERESLPYKAVDTVIDDLSHYLASLGTDDASALLPDHVGLLRRLFPVVDKVPAIQEARITEIDVQNPHELRARVFAVLRALLTNVARARKLVVIIDDLQWADADSLALLDEVMRPPGAPALLLLGTMRSDTESRRRPSAVSEAIARFPGDVRHVRLDPLPSGDARELIGHLLEASPSGPRLPADVDAMLAEAKGHPLFIDELVRHHAAHRTAAPTRLDDALWERASELPEAARKLLEVIVVAGVPLAQHIVGRAAALDGGRLFELVAALRSAHLVRTSGVYRADTIEPYHDRVRESVMSHLDGATRIDWHGRLALALEQSEQADPEMLMTQWRGAGNDARAADYAVRAADHAAAALAFEHAATLYRAAIDLGAGAQDRTLQVKLAEALSNAGRGGDAAKAYLAAAGDGTSSDAIDLRRRAAAEYVCSGHADEGKAVFAAVLASAGVRSPESPAAVLFSLLFFSLALMLRGLRFSPRPAHACDPRDLLRVDCLNSAGSAFGMTDHVRGKEFQTRTLLLALRVGEPSRVLRALAFHALSTASSGGPSYARTMRLHERLVAMAADVRQPYSDAITGGVAAYAYIFTGQWQKARMLLAQTEAIFRDQCVGVAYELSSVRTILCRALGSMGELSELAVRTEAALRDSERRGDRFLSINLRSSGRVPLALVADDPDTAQRELDLATSGLTKNAFHVQHFYCMIAQAQVLLYRGDAAAALRHLDAWSTPLKRSMLLRVQSFRIFTHDMRARCCLVSAATAATAAERATWARCASRHARAIARERLPWATAIAQLLAAALADQAGDRGAALAQYAQVEAAFASCQMALHAAVALRRRGTLLGGDEGRALVTRAESWMASQGVVSPARMTAAYAPARERRA